MDTATKETIDCKLKLEFYDFFSRGMWGTIKSAIDSTRMSRQSVPLSVY